MWSCCTDIILLYRTLERNKIPSGFQDSSCPHLIPQHLHTQCRVRSKMKCQARPATLTHISSYNLSLRNSATHSLVHPIPLLKEQAPYAQGQFILHLPFLLLCPLGVIQFLLLHALSLKPSPRTCRKTAPCFKEFLWALLWSRFPWSFFFSFPQLSPSCPLPPSCCLLLFPCLSLELC